MVHFRSTQETYESAKEEGLAQGFWLGLTLGLVLGSVVAIGCVLF